MFRSSLIPAALWASGLTPLLAWQTPLLWANPSGLVWGEYLAAVALFYPIGALVTFIGILLVAYPLTYCGERIGRGNRWPILVLNGSVGLLGFWLAATAEWPSVASQQIFWLHMGFAAMIFTGRYLLADRAEGPEPVDSARIA